VANDQPITTYAQFEARLAELDREIRRAEDQGRSTDALHKIREQVVRDWQQPAES
jgi:hypothetical protein